MDSTKEKKKFAFQVPTIPAHAVMSLHLPVETYERLSLAAKTIPKTEVETDQTRRVNKKRMAKGTVQELVRQMIDHCLQDMGY